MTFMERSDLEWKTLLEKAEDRREIKNVLGKFSQSLLLFLDEEMKELWSNRTDICLGLNFGWFVGRDEVLRYFTEKRNADSDKAITIQKIFSEKLGDVPMNDLYGIGVFEEKPVANPVIEIANDRKTAKAAWYSQGSYADITRQGPIAFWTWGTFGADLVLEEEEWKIWHLIYLEDIKGPVGTNFAIHDEKEFPRLDEFKAINEFIPEPTCRRTLREAYSPMRPFTKLIELPEAYENFTHTFSYGYAKEEGEQMK